MAAERTAAGSPRRVGRFPEFCGERAALVLVLGTELVAIALALFGADSIAQFWSRLAWLSLFALWVTLLTAVNLCLARRLLLRLALPLAMTVAIAVAVAWTLLVSELAWRLGQRWSFDFGFERVGHPAYLARNAGLASLVAFVVLQYLALQQRWRDEVEAEARARIDALTARINPHFLFNTLNTAMALVHARPDHAERVLGDLADLFRNALLDARTLTPLGQELELARAYLAIEEQRLGPRLRIRWEADALPVDALVPRLMLQPLVENAVFHGIEQLVEGGELAIRGGRDGDALWLEVRNPAPTTPAARTPAGGNMALDNVRQRLELAYEGAATLAAVPEPGAFVATLRFPYRCTSS